VWPAGRARAILPRPWHGYDSFVSASSIAACVAKKQHRQCVLPFLLRTLFFSPSWCTSAAIRNVWVRCGWLRDGTSSPATTSTLPPVRVATLLTLHVVGDGRDGGGDGSTCVVSSFSSTQINAQCVPLTDMSVVSALAQRKSTGRKTCALHSLCVCVIAETTTSTS
jgi:hypothetical protein